MLRRKAVEFQRPVTSGKSRPLFVFCEASDGSIVEVVAKFSAFCERGVTSLSMEVIAACLAADLGLPISEPVLVEFDQEWAELIPERIGATECVQARG